MTKYIKPHDTIEDGYQRHRIAANNLVFAFTDDRAVIKYTDFYDNLQTLNAVDWKIMQDKYWI
jgi:hypothetical protein